MKSKVFFPVIALLLAVSIWRVGNYIYNGNAGLKRELRTERTLLCDACGMSSPVSQEQLMLLYKPNNPTRENGEPYLACPECSATSAYLVVTEVGHER